MCSQRYEWSNLRRWFKEGVRTIQSGSRLWHEKLHWMPKPFRTIHVNSNGIFQSSELEIIEIKNVLTLIRCRIDVGIAFARNFVEFQQNTRDVSVFDLPVFWLWKWLFILFCVVYLKNHGLAVELNDRIKDQCINRSILFVFNGKMSAQSYGKFGIIERFQCIIQAITKAVKDSDISRVWTVVRRELERIVDKTRSCRSESNIFNQMKFVAKWHLYARWIH